MSQAEDGEVSLGSPQRNEDNRLSSMKKFKILTPSYTRSKARRMAHLRREILLRQRILTLKRRNKSIKLKANACRRERELKIDASSFVSSLHLANATERRLKHLEAVRLKARLLRLHLQTITPEQCCSHSFEAEKYQVPLKNISENNADHINGSQWTQIKVIQSAIRTKLLRHSINDVRESKLIPNIVDSYYTYEQARMLVCSSKVDQLCLLLERLNLPYPISMKPYAWFLFSIMLISDFEKCVKSNKLFNAEQRVFEHGPFISLSSFLIHLPIILRQVSLRILASLINLFDLPLNVVINPISPLRLYLARVWRTYHFYFIFVKRYKRLQMKHTANREFDAALYQITTTQMVMTNREQLVYDRILALEWHKYRIRSLCETQNLSWAQTSESLDALYRQIERIGSVRKRKGQLPGLCYDLVYESRILSSDDHFHKLVTISKGRYYFFVPPDVSISKWRTFWFNKFKGREVALSTIGVPKRMRSGIKQSLLHEEVSFSISDIMLLRDSPIALQNPFDIEAWKSELFSLDSLLTSIFFSFCDYCFQIGEEMETSEAIFNLRQFQSEYMLQDEGIFNSVLAITYFRIYLLLICQIVVIADADTTKLNEILSKQNMDFKDLSLAIYNMCHDCEAQLFVKWFYYCKPIDFRNFIMSENIYQLAIECCNKKDLGAHSPQLRFPGFYWFVLLNRPEEFKHPIDAFLIVTANLWGPLFDSEEPQEKAKEFYSSTIVTFIMTDLHLTVSEKWKRHKIELIGFFDQFKSPLMDLCKDARSLMWASCTSHMLQLEPHQAQLVYNHFQKGWNLSLLESRMRSAGASQFQILYLLHALTTKSEQEVINLFSRKLLSSFQGNSSAGKEIRRICPFFTNKALILQQNIMEFNSIFYGLYYPLLNWIYVDLGSPHQLLAGNG